MGGLVAGGNGDPFMVYQIAQLLKFPDPFAETTAANRVESLKLADSLGVGFQVVKKAGVLGHPCILHPFLLSCKRRLL